MSTIEATPKTPSWAQKEIGLRQLATQKQAMEFALLQLELNMRPESGTRVLYAREELRERIRFLTEAERSLAKQTTKPKRPWSTLILRLYQWATEDRLKTTD